MAHRVIRELLREEQLELLLQRSLRHALYK
jgi:hypothetical protein